MTVRHLPKVSGPAFLTLIGLALFWGGPVWGQEGSGYEIRLPPEIRSDQVQASYVLRGPFGTYQDVVKAEPERNVYQILTEVKHQAADSLKLILYAPGCQIVTIDVPSLAESEMNSDVACDDLPSLEFKARVEPPASLQGQPYDVEVRYVAYWAPEFFEVESAPATVIQLTRVTPDAAGAFHLLLPNFIKDVVTQSFGRNAGLRFLARPRLGGEAVALGPANVERKNASDLPIRSKYPPEVLFKQLPSKHPG